MAQIYSCAVESLAISLAAAKLFVWSPFLAFRLILLTACLSRCMFHSCTSRTFSWFKPNHTAIYKMLHLNSLSRWRELICHYDTLAIRSSLSFVVFSVTYTQCHCLLSHQDPTYGVLQRVQYRKRAFCRSSWANLDSQIPRPTLPGNDLWFPPRRSRWLG